MLSKSERSISAASRLIEESSMVQVPKNDWKKKLEPEISKKIENEFRQEMIELGYL